MTSFTNFQLEWQVQAVDNDWADNGRVQYSLINATPSNGRSKFVINPETGVIDAVGAVNPGEKYALNLEVSYWHSAQTNQIILILIFMLPSLILWICESKGWLSTYTRT